MRHRFSPLASLLILSLVVASSVESVYAASSFRKRNTHSVISTQRRREERLGIREKSNFSTATKKTQKEKQGSPSESKADPYAAQLKEYYQNGQDRFTSMLEMTKVYPTETALVMLQILKELSRNLGIYGKLTAIAQSRPLTEAELAVLVQASQSMLDSSQDFLDEQEREPSGHSTPASTPSSCSKFGKHAHWSDEQNSCVCNEGFKPSDDVKYCVVNQEWYDAQNQSFPKQSQSPTYWTPQETQEAVCARERNKAAALGINFDSNWLWSQVGIGCVTRERYCEVMRTSFGTGGGDRCK